MERDDGFWDARYHCTQCLGRAPTLTKPPTRSPTVAAAAASGKASPVKTLPLRARTLPEAQSRDAAERECGRLGATPPTMSR